MRHFLSAVMLFMCCLAVFAQDAPKAEVFAGFSYANYELLAPSASFSNSNETLSGNPSGRLGLFGWNGSVAVNLNRWFSLTTDFSGYYSGSMVSTTSTETITPCPGCSPQTIVDTNVVSSPKFHNFLFGPQFSYPAGKIRPFAHFLLGEQHSDMTRSSSLTIIGCTNCTSIGGAPISAQGSTGFAVALGGGTDYSIKHNLAWRLESDYLTNQGTHQNHVRVSTGLVWRLGN
jgi:hypothetical protein